MQVHTIETLSLGDRSYVVTDGALAAVIDPQRDIDRVLDLLQAHGLTVSHVMETHTHNDYVSGGYELARQTGATYIVSAHEELLIPFFGVVDGDEVDVGNITIRAISTPGHTPTHLAYLATHGAQQAVFTGGSMLYGSVGRTDLSSPASQDALTRDQFHSVRLLAAEADPTELARRVHAGEWVVDLRSCTAFATDHVTGTINIEVGRPFVTYLAWLIPWGTPVTLVGDRQDEVAEAQRQLVRVGIDRPAAQAVGGPAAYGVGVDRGNYRVVDFKEVVEELSQGAMVHVLDVRRDDERSAGGIAGSIHIPIHDLEHRMDEIPTDGEVWVHCTTGFRAAAAASLLARAGRTPVLINDTQDRLNDLGFYLA